MVKTIFRLKRKRKSLRAIARELNEMRTPTARGGKWYAGTVKYILKNPIYRGLLNYNGVKAKKPELALF